LAQLLLGQTGPPGGLAPRAAQKPTAEELPGAQLEGALELIPPSLLLEKQVVDGAGAAVAGVLVERGLERGGGPRGIAGPAQHARQLAQKGRPKLSLGLLRTGAEEGDDGGLGMGE